MVFQKAAGIAMLAIAAAVVFLAIGASSPADRDATAAPIIAMFGFYLLCAKRRVFGCRKEDFTHDERDI